MSREKTQAWVGLVVAVVVMGVALFGSAGTIRYWQAWLWLCVVAISSTLLILYMVRDPVLLENRSTFGPAAEQRPLQRIIVMCMGVPLIAAFIVPGLDHRFGWSSVPPWLSVVGILLVLVSMWMVYRVFKANSFGSATVGVAEGQSVVTTGPYAIVRNPMYASAVVYFIATSLALGSYWALVPSALIILAFVWRLLDEEEFLAQNLSGYTEYCAKVRWHLIPGIF